VRRRNGPLPGEGVDQRQDGGDVAGDVAGADGEERLDGGRHVGRPGRRRPRRAVRRGRPVGAGQPDQHRLPQARPALRRRPPEALGQARTLADGQGPVATVGPGRRQPDGGAAQPVGQGVAARRQVQGRHRFGQGQPYHRRGQGHAVPGGPGQRDRAPRCRPHLPQQRHFAPAVAMVGQEVLERRLRLRRDQPRLARAGRPAQLNLFRPGDARRQAEADADLGLTRAPAGVSGQLRLPGLDLGLAQRRRRRCRLPRGPVHPGPVHPGPVPPTGAGAEVERVGRGRCRVRRRRSEPAQEQHQLHHIPLHRAPSPVRHTCAPHLRAAPAWPPARPSAGRRSGSGLDRAGIGPGSGRDRAGRALPKISQGAIVALCRVSQSRPPAARAERSARRPEWSSSSRRPSA
jgi:hypothetical protein